MTPAPTSNLRQPRLTELCVQELSKTIAMRAFQPVPFFAPRSGVSLESMSVLELMAELDRRDWVKSDQVQNRRNIEPYDVQSGAPRVWYLKTGESPFKEYLMALLTGDTKGLSTVFHLQCRSYYQCLMNSDGQTSSILPHQAAQYYKALTARRRRGAGLCRGEEEDDMETEPRARRRQFQSEGEGDAMCLDNPLNDSDPSPGPGGVRSSALRSGEKKRRKRTTVVAPRTKSKVSRVAPTPTVENAAASYRCQCQCQRIISRAVGWE